MEFDKVQKISLQRYRQYLTTPPTFGLLTRQSFGAHLFLVTLTLSCSGLLMMLDQKFLAYFLAGFGIGGVVRDFAYIRRFLKVWPVLAQILDSKRIDVLAQKNNLDNAA